MFPEAAKTSVQKPVATSSNAFKNSSKELAKLEYILAAKNIRQELKQAAILRRNALLKRNYRQLLPYMNFLHHHMEKLVFLLNELKEDVAIKNSYELAGKCGRIRIEGTYTHYKIEPRVSPYLIEDALHNTSRDFHLICHCSAERKTLMQLVEFRKNSEKKTNLEQELDEYHIHYTASEKACNNGDIKSVFYIEPCVPVELEWVGNPKENLIELTIKNANSNELSIVQYHILPENINPKLVDELVKYITKKPNQLDHLIMKKSSKKPSWLVKDELYAQRYPQVSRAQPNPHNIKKEVDIRELLLDTNKNILNIKKEVKNTHREVNNLHDTLYSVKDDVDEVQSQLEKNEKDIVTIRNTTQRMEVNVQHTSMLVSLFAWIFNLLKTSR